MKSDPRFAERDDRMRNQKELQEILEAHLATDTAAAWEEKLIAAVERGVIPHSIAMEIARAKDGEVQQALAQAYEEKSIPGNQVLAIRQIIEQRNNSGKQLHKRGPRSGRTQKAVT